MDKKIPALPEQLSYAECLRIMPQLRACPRLLQEKSQHNRAGHVLSFEERTQLGILCAIVRFQSPDCFIKTKDFFRLVRRFGVQNLEVPEELKLIPNITFKQFISKFPNISKVYIPSPFEAKGMEFQRVYFQKPHSKQQVKRYGVK